MSRIGKKPVKIPNGVTIELKNGMISVKGPKGELNDRINPDVNIVLKDDNVIIERKSDAKKVKALHGLWRALVQNMVLGVTQGFSKKLEIIGVGYRAEMKGSKLNLLLGYSHPIIFAPPEGIKIETPTQTNIIVSGIHKQLVGLVAAKIRSLRPPEPYKGKGIRYEREMVRRKAGKAAATSAK